MESLRRDLAEAHSCSLREALAGLGQQRDTAMREAREAWDRERERLREKVSEWNTKWTHTTPPLPVCSAGVTGGAAAGSAAVQLLITGGGEKRGRAADISSQVRGWLQGGGEIGRAHV